MPTEDCLKVRVEAPPPSISAPTTEVPPNMDIDPGGWVNPDSDEEMGCPSPELSPSRDIQSMDVERTAVASAGLSALPNVPQPSSIHPHQDLILQLQPFIDNTRQQLIGIAKLTWSDTLQDCVLYFPEHKKTRGKEVEVQL